MRGGIYQLMDCLDIERDIVYNTNRINGGYSCWIL